jgi:hypothetical protein
MGWRHEVEACSIERSQVAQLSRGELSRWVILSTSLSAPFAAPLLCASRGIPGYDMLDSCLPSASLPRSDCISSSARP